MELLQKVKEYGRSRKDQPVFYAGDQYLTYGELDTYSNRLAAYLEEQLPNDHTPIVVYGHKNPFMLVCFLACVKSKRAYCPIDISVPFSRVQMIIDVVDSSVVLALEPVEANGKKIIGLEQIKTITTEYEHEIEQTKWVQAEDSYYIIFTSGSTGVPKGVQITYACLNHYLDWSVNLGNTQAEKEGKVFLNQAPFSFDLSVMDLYTCLACGGTLWTLDKNTQNDFSAMLDSFQRSQASIWVSTPSFADVCLSDPKFAQELLAQLEVFLFCGETLTNRTAKKLLERFPHAKVINTYGPTESTVAMTSVDVTTELCEEESPLPVGVPKAGSFIEIRKEDGTLASDGEHGEIIILGDTVSIGYYKQEDLSKKVFFEQESEGKMLRGYRSGDEGYVKGNMLYYGGRIDLQIKLHGYRIELEDIENNLLNIDGIDQAVVVPNMQEGKVKSLAAFVICKARENSDFATSQKIKKSLKEYLPDYMIPKKIMFMDQIPMTVNGKADRKHLGGLLA